MRKLSFDGVTASEYQSTGRGQLLTCAAVPCAAEGLRQPRMLHVGGLMSDVETRFGLVLCRLAKLSRITATTRLRKTKEPITWKDMK